MSDFAWKITDVQDDQPTLGGVTVYVDYFYKSNNIVFSSAAFVYEVAPPRGQIIHDIIETGKNESTPVSKSRVAIGETGDLMT